MSLGPKRSNRRCANPAALTKDVLLAEFCRQHRPDACCAAYYWDMTFRNKNAATDLVGDGWEGVLAPVADTIAALGERLRAEQAAGQRFAPAGDRVFAALAMPIASVRVLVVGQDPYPTPGHAIGLAFAVERGVRPLPASLRNILTEYRSDLDLPAPVHGDLGAWVAQGVLLLNRVLTVRHGEPASHRGWGWERVTDAIVDGLLAHHASAGIPLVALLWGRDAQTLAARLTAGGAHILTAPHPSPLSAHRGFLGSRPFTRTNALLEAAGATPIDWRLPA
jgi:uracil-DNA glycosylase